MTANETGDIPPQAPPRRQGLRGIPRLFMFALLVALPLGLFWQVGRHWWYWRILDPEALLAGAYQAETIRVLARIAFFAVTAFTSLCAGLLLAKGRRSGLFFAKLTFLLLMAETLAHPLFIYLLPYPVLARDVVLDHAGGLSGAAMFARAAGWGVCLAYACASKELARHAGRA